jgi:hypothetical protein
MSTLTPAQAAQVARLHWSAQGQHNRAVVRAANAQLLAYFNSPDCEISVLDLIKWRVEHCPRMTQPDVRLGD